MNRSSGTSGMRFWIGWIGVWALWYALAWAVPAVSARMNSSNYAVSFENMNITSGSKTNLSGSYNVTDTVGQTGSGQYGQLGPGGSQRVVRSGFQYLYSIIPFQFSISNTLVDLGELTPGAFSTGTTTLTVSSGGAGAYQVTAQANKPLTLVGGSTTIPDTTCNSNDCSETTSGVWTSTSAYGFGYRMSGQDIPGDFSASDTFKQFADDSQNEAPQVVMSSSSVGKNRSATVTYKAVISGTQAAGRYENSITYVATPGY